MTIVDGNADNLISGGVFHERVEQVAHTYYGDHYANQITNNYYRDVLAALALDANELRRVRDSYVKTPELDVARSALENESAVALIGQPGCGRRTTGIVLLASLGITPKTVMVDPEGFDRQLDVAPGHGYLLNLDEDHDQLTAKAGAWIHDLGVRLRAMNSCLIVRAREHTWRALELSEGALRTVRMTPPLAVAVFRSHLASMTSDPIAEVWAQHERVVSTLATAIPSDGVRLARIIAETAAVTAPAEQQIEQVMAEYSNWETELAEWFRQTTRPDGGYARALLLAAAALEGAPAATVFGATDRLASLVGLPGEPGGALVGPDATELVRRIHAELHGRSIRFPRPAYGQSVLDHVWDARPHLQSALRQWLTDIPSPRDEGSGRAAQTLTGLAIRQREATLVCTAAEQWARNPASGRELAVGALTEAALSEQIGRGVRRQLYEWARSAGAAESTHLAVAAVCSGQLARAYPQIALTRLRHLAVRQNAIVQESVLEGLAGLVQDPALRRSVLNEIDDWAGRREPRRSAGLQAFLRLARPDDNGEITILSGTGEPDWDLLAGLWREALRDDRPDGVATAAGATAAGWLDAAVAEKAPRNAVLEILSRTCHSSIDMAAIADFAYSRADASENADSRRDIAAEIVRRAWDRCLIIAGQRQTGGAPS
jgi:hypothetical protein